MLLIAVRTQAEIVACIIGEDIASMGPLGLVGRCEGGRGAIIVNSGDASPEGFAALRWWRLLIGRRRHGPKTPITGQ
jgi:hypothetical protein